MYEIPVYTAELDAGIADKVRTSASIAYASDVKVVDAFRHDVESLSLATVRAAVAKGARNDFDLYFIEDILVSTGWNKNDDVFDRLETWAARYTPEDKPFNYEHDCADIIGHIIGNYVIGDDNKLISDDATVDILPAKFHIVNGSVIYKIWDKADLQTRMDQTMREVSKGLWFVSMEAHFRGFDYACIAQDGTAKIIARNEQTAFLTKHLRAYGGDGVYEELKVGRLLRHIVFGGKGLVRRAANPNSVILTQAKNKEFPSVFGNLTDFSRLAAKSGYSQSDTTHTECKDTMATEIETLQKQLTASQAEVEKLTQSIADSNVKQVQAQLKATQEEKAKAEEALKQANEQLAKAEKGCQAQADEVKALKASIEKAEKDHKTVADELNQLKASAKQSQRLAAVKSALKVQETDAEGAKGAADMVASLSDLSDEKFDIQIKAISKFTPAPLPPKQTPAPLPPKQTNKPAPMGGKASETEDPAAANADPAVLDTAVAETEPAMAHENVSEETEKFRKSVASYFGCETDEDTEE